MLINQSSLVLIARSRALLSPLLRQISVTSCSEGAFNYGVRPLIFFIITHIRFFPGALVWQPAKFFQTFSGSYSLLKPTKKFSLYFLFLLEPWSSSKSLTDLSCWKAYSLQLRCYFIPPIFNSSIYVACSHYLFYLSEIGIMAPQYHLYEWIPFELSHIATSPSDWYEYSEPELVPRKVDTFPVLTSIKYSESLE